MDSPAPTGAAYFSLVEERNWGGPDMAAYELVLGVDLLGEEEADALLRSIRALAAAAELSPREPVRVVDDREPPRRRFRVSIPVKDGVAGIDFAPEDPLLLRAALSIEAGLAQALRSAPISVNGRFLTLPNIPFKPGDRVRLRHPAYEGFCLTVLRVEAEKGILRLEAKGSVLGKSFQTEFDADFRDVFALPSPP